MRMPPPAAMPESEPESEPESGRGRAARVMSSAGRGRWSPSVPRGRWNAAVRQRMH